MPKSPAQNPGGASGNGTRAAISGKRRSPISLSARRHLKEDHDKSEQPRPTA